MMSETAMKKPYFVVLGNEKGGTGKSTVAMHLIVNLLRLGFKVGCIDVDARQGTLTRYFDNRRHYCESQGVNLALPDYQTVHKSSADRRAEAEKEETASFNEVQAQLQGHDFIVVDTPGNDTCLSRLAHAHADTLITPMNDSFVDLDVLVTIKDLQNKEIKPSIYAETVWQQKKERLMRDKVSMDWIVLRNRLSNIHARNKEEMWETLKLLSNRLGFRLAAGFGERVIFRELFLKGLTLLDLKDLDLPLRMSHITARQELRSLMQIIDLPHLRESLDEAA
ncbi:MAG: division plane positioning ATPase MipZ [Pseudomonadota bacterium]